MVIFVFVFFIEFVNSIELFCREPTHNGDPVSGFLPIQNGQMNYLNITNDKMEMGVDPNKDTYELWSQIEAQVNEINKKNQS